MKRFAHRPTRPLNVLAVAAITATLCGAPEPAGAEDVPGDVPSGRVLAAEVCAKCHNVRANGNRSPLPEAPPFQWIADMPATTALSLRVFLQTPHRLMPDIRLTTKERDDVISYILSLKRRKT